MNAKFIQRFGAYIIDAVILLVIIGVFGGLFQSDKAKELTKQYNNLYGELSEKLTDLNSDINAADSESDNSDNNSQDSEQGNNELVTEESKINNEQKLQEINKLSDELNNVNYQLQKETFIKTLISILIYILYFVVFQVYNNGQTFGKKVFKIKIIKNDNTDISYSSLMLRGIVLYGFLSNVIMVILIFILSKESYLDISVLINLLQLLIFVISGIMVLFKSNKRGLHDIIAGTKVVVIDNSDEGIYSKWQKALILPNNKDIIDNREVGINRKHTSGKRKGEKENERTDRTRTS